MKPGWMSRFQQIMTVDEGVRYKLYDDSTGKEVILSTGGKVTGGIGRNFSDKPLSPEAVTFLFSEDAREALQSAINIFGGQFDGWSEQRQLGIMNLCFNLGETKLRKFYTTLWAIRNNNWALVADRLRKTLWYKQVKSVRGERVIKLVKDEVYDQAYGVFL